MGTSNAADLVRPDRCTTVAPRSAWWTTTSSGPRERRWSAASIGDDRPATADTSTSCPKNVVTFGRQARTAAMRSSGQPCGSVETSRDVANPRRRARARRRAVGRPIRRCVHQKPDRWRWSEPSSNREGTSRRTRLAFAPSAVMSARPPADHVRAIVAPVGRRGSTRRTARTPWRRYASRRTAPFGSAPIAPTKLVRAPRLAIARAKFVAFPPGSASTPGTCPWKSPGGIGGSGGVMRSTIASPTATTRGCLRAILTPSRGLVASARRPRPCSPPAGRTPGRRGSRARPAPGSRPPSRRIGTRRRSPASGTSEEIFERELLLRLPAAVLGRRRLAEVIAEQRLLLGRLRAGQQRLLVPAVHLRDVGERLRDAPGVVFPVGPLLERPPGHVGLDLHGALLGVRHDPRDFHPGHELLPHLLELAGGDHVAHRIRVHVLVLLLHGPGDDQGLNRVPLRVLQGRGTRADFGDDLLRQGDRSILVAVEDLLEHALLRLALQVERVRAADLVSAYHELIAHFGRPGDLARIPLLPSVAEQGLEDLVDFHRDPTAREPLGRLPCDLEGRVESRGGRLEEDGIGVGVDDFHRIGLELPDDALDPLPRERGDRRPDLRIVEPVERRGEDAIEGVHEDLDRGLQAFVELSHLRVGRLFHLRPHVLAVVHEPRQDRGEEPLLDVGAEELRTGRARDRAGGRDRREADVVLYDEGRIHRAQVEGDHPFVEPGLQAVDVPAFDLLDAASPHLHHRHRDARSVRGPDQDRVDQVRRAPMQHVLERELAHRRQVEGLLDPADLLEDPEREVGVVQAIPDDLVAVPRPLLVDLSSRELVLPFAQQLARHVVEGLLLHVQAQPLRFHGPPHVREDAAVDPPEPLPEVEEVREVAGEPELWNPVLGGAVDEDGQVVAVDVVSGDDVGIELVDELDEPLDDLPLAPRQDERLDRTGVPVRNADAEDVAVLDAVLDVEAQDADGRAEVQVVDEPMLERDVGLQGGGAVSPGLLAVLGRLPRLSEDDACARSRLSFELQGHVLEVDDLRIPAERSPEGVRRLDHEEVWLESGILDGDALPFPRPPKHLDDRQLGRLGAVPGLPPVGGRDDPNIVAGHLTPSPRS